MKQFLRGQRKIRDDERPQLADSPQSDSNIEDSINTAKVVTTPSPISKEVSDAGTSCVSEPDIIGEYEESREAGQSPVNPESRISTLSAQIAPFEVPTRRFPLSSGFPYHRQLFHFKVSPDEWSRFTDDVTRASSLSTLARWAVWGTGVTVGVTSSAVLTIFGIPPGYYAGKAVYSKAVARKVRQGLKEEGEIEAIMKFWNETVFMKKGCRVHLELPTRKKDKKENVNDNTSDNGSAEEIKKAGSSGGDKDSEKRNKKTEKFFKLIVEPLMEENLSGPLFVSPGLDRLKEAALREINEQGTDANRNTVSSIPSPSLTEPPAYAPGTFVQELEANSPGTAVESGAREIREMPESTKTMND